MSNTKVDFFKTAREYEIVVLAILKKHKTPNVEKALQNVGRTVVIIHSHSDVRDTFLYISNFNYDGKEHYLFLECTSDAFYILEPPFTTPSKDKKV
jgi:hypothetical protein